MQYRAFTCASQYIFPLYGTEAASYVVREVGCPAIAAEDDDSAVGRGKSTSYQCVWTTEGGPSAGNGTFVEGSLASTASPYISYGDFSDSLSGSHGVHSPV